MKSLTGNFSSVRGWVLLLALLLGAGMMISACGEEEVPAPTTPAPPPPPPPPPAPVAPATPTGLTVSGSTASSITWTWNAVEGATGYVVQSNTDEMWDDTDTVTFNGAPFTTMTTYTASDLEVGATVYVRVAAAAGTADAPLVSDFSTHVKGTAMLMAPTNVRVTGRTATTITWTWDAVEGALLYQGQFSGDATFTGPPDDPFFVIIAPVTSHTVERLSGNMTGHFRVRSGSGTSATDATYSDWSGGVSGTTTGPAAATAIDAPGNLRSIDTTRSSITLEWDEVDEAEAYDVQQRVADGAWADASCGGEGASVEDPECEATGLTRGTDYTFRVAALPNAADTTRLRSAWTTLDDPVRTEGVAPRPRPAGGSGDLNITWRSRTVGGTRTITWRWDQENDVDYEHKMLEGALDADAPCEDRSMQWSRMRELSSSYRTPTTGAGSLTANGARLLCVRATWLDSSGDRKYGDPSWAWGATQPDAPVRPTSGSVVLVDGITESLKWDVTLAGAGAIQYDFRYLIKDMDNPADFTEPTTANSQSLCEAARTAEMLTPGGSTFNSFTTSGDLDDYSAYYLCYRAQNDSGTSDWAVALSGAELYTAPGKPSAGSPTRSDGSATGTYDFALTVTRPSGGPSVPLTDGAIGTYFDVRYVVTNADADANGTDELRDEEDVIKACNNTTSASDGFASAAQSIGSFTRTSNTQFTGTASSITRAAATGATHYIYFCARAQHSTTGNGQDPGPWVVSRGSVDKQS